MSCCWHAADWFLLLKGFEKELLRFLAAGLRKSAFIHHFIFII
jgi:hypothetical protein